MHNIAIKTSTITKRFVIRVHDYIVTKKFNDFDRFAVITRTIIVTRVMKGEIWKTFYPKTPLFVVEEEGSRENMSGREKCVF